MTNKFDLARRNMVVSQIMTNIKPSPSLAKSFYEINREDFLPAHLKSLAYIDDHINIGNDRYLMSPMVMAKIYEIAEITKEDKVLDIACATGYSSAILSKLAKEVVAVEEDFELFKRASNVIADLGISNVKLVNAKHSDGCLEEGPYDVIIINGAMKNVSDALKFQLKNGGKLVTVKYSNESKKLYNSIIFGNITRINKNNNILSELEILPIYMYQLKGV